MIFFNYRYVELMKKANEYNSGGDSRQAGTGRPYSGQHSGVPQGPAPGNVYGKICFHLVSTLKGLSGLVSGFESIGSRVGLTCKSNQYF